MVGETETEIIVAFRGTLPPTSNSPDQRQVLLDWLGDLDAFLVAGADLPGLVHQGFLGALDALWPDVANAITPGKTLYFTGHSKGGAIANLAAARHQQQNQAAAGAGGDDLCRGQAGRPRFSSANTTRWSRIACAMKIATISCRICRRA